MKLEIQPVQYHQLHTLQRIAIKTFCDAFEEQNNPEDFQQYLKEKMSISHFEKEFENDSSTFYFGYHKDIVIGYLKINFESPLPAYNLFKCAELQRIYVLENHQGKGFGRQLLEFAITKTLQYPCKALWLGVWEHNADAIRFYQREGFAEVGSHTFTLGGDPQTDLVLVKHH